MGRPFPFQEPRGIDLPADSMPKFHAVGCGRNDAEFPSRLSPVAKNTTNTEKSGLDRGWPTCTGESRVQHYPSLHCPNKRKLSRVMRLENPNDYHGFSLFGQSILVCMTLLFWACPQETQAQFGPPRGGGPNAPDQEIVKDFDKDGDGILNRAERDEAKKALAQPNAGRSGKGKRRGGKGRQGNRPEGKPGPKVSPSDVENHPDADLYDPNVLRTIFIDFEEDDWEDEMAIFKPTDVEIPATLTVDGVTYPNVGMSFRGASSFFMIPKGSKRSLNLSMDFLEKDQNLYGYKSLNLLNCNGDASLMSSFLYSDIASEKIATPKVNFVKVVINGRSWGVYANAQQFNKDFLKENYGSKKGNRWKVSGSPQGDAGLRYLGDDVEAYRTRFDIKSKDKPEAWADLINLCKVLNETPSDELIEKLDPILDLDGTLWFLAADVALINSDGYWVRASDYSIYENEDGKFHILPHDMNEAFRASRGGGGKRGGPRAGRRPPFGERGPQGPPPGERPPFQERPERGQERPGDQRAQNRGRPPEPNNQRPPQSGGGPRNGMGGGYALDPLVGLNEDRFPLRSKLLANPVLKTRYLQYLRAIAENQLDWENLGPKVAMSRDLIKSDVYSDTRKLMGNSDFDAATNSNPSPTPGSLQEFAVQRSKFLLDHPAIKDLPTELVEIRSTTNRSKNRQDEN